MKVHNKRESVRQYDSFYGMLFIFSNTDREGMPPRTLQMLEPSFLLHRRSGISHSSKQEVEKKPAFP
ncbi:hypothetical protein D1872_188550 [compost metagenome]